MTQHPPVIKSLLPRRRTSPGVLIHQWGK